jgi:hypothetical protein
VFLNVVDPGIVTDLNLSVHIGMPYADDVSIFLANGATVVQVYTGVGDTEESVINATFDDEALSDYPVNGSAIGTFRPSPEALSAFNGMPLAGTWELRLWDLVLADDGTPLLSWSISGETDGEVIPEPSTLVLASLGIGLLAAMRLRRSRATPAD